MLDSYNDRESRPIVRASFVDLLPYRAIVSLL